MFPHHLKRLREAIFAGKRREVARIARDIVLLVREEGSGLDAHRKKDAQDTIDRLVSRSGYCPFCASDAANMLVRKRFHDVLT